MRNQLEIVDGQLAETLREAMRITAKMQADGVSKDEREAFMATALREAWPKSREAPWVYYCATCGDTGWAWKTCGHRSCGRPFTLPKQHGDDYTGRGRCADGHAYAVPCSCAKGEAQRRLLMKERRVEDAMEVAAKVTKPTRLGR